jgi:trans-aconitate methyltransferase
MSDLNRENSSFLTRMLRAVRSLIKLVSDLLKGSITVKQFLLDLRFRFVQKRKVQNDDFNWEIYPAYYKEELKSISKIHTLIIQDGNFIFEKGQLVKADPQMQNLHPNHEVLYQIIASIKPKSVLEVGCGGGDHLSNINELCPGTKLIGLDRSQEQFQTLRDRHPFLSVETNVVDITNSGDKKLSAELVYSQAVLMHISETDGRFNKAMDFIFSSAEEIVVLIENWTQHNFLKEINRIQVEKYLWRDSFLYSVKSKTDPYASAIIVSRIPLSNFPALSTYDELLAGRKIQTH